MVPPRARPGWREFVRRPWLAAAVAGLLALQLVLTNASTRQMSLTHDEILHLAGGTSYWVHGDYRLHPENGALPQLWGSMPIAFSGDYQFPEARGDDWHNSRQMVLADRFCHEEGNDLAAMLRLGRGAMSLLGFGLSLLVFAWARQLWGVRGALAALGLCATSPTVLAHGGLITSDMCFALFLSLGVWSVWRTLQRVTVGRVLVSATAVGGLMVSKMSGPLVLPMAVVMVVVRLSSRRPLLLAWPGRQPWELRRVASQALVVSGLVVAHLAVALLVVWATYGFRYSAFHPEGVPAARFPFNTTLEEATEGAGAAGAVIRWCGEKQILPEAYLHGMAVVVGAQERLAFLNGEFSSRGFWTFFPFCLLAKTPLPLFGLLLAAAAVWWHASRRRRASWCYRATPLLCLLAVYWAAALATPLNIGHRHILATYPAMFVLAGGAARWMRRGRRPVSALVVGLLALFAAESLRAYPHYLAYFNQVTGRDNAYRHVVASSLDWGQDLPGLATWLAEREQDSRPVYLAYFGSDRPSAYAIEAAWIPVAAWLPNDRLHQRSPQLRGGLYCISATALQSVVADYPGRWNAGYEQAYQAARARHRAPARLLPTERAANRRLLDRLRAARLMAWLRQREPAHRIGYSILVYELSDDDVRQALDGPPAEMFSDYTGTRPG